MQTFTQVMAQAGLGQPPMTLRPPVELDPRVYDYLSARAAIRGIAVNELVNDLLKKSIELSWRLTS